MRGIIILACGGLMMFSPMVLHSMLVKTHRDGRCGGEVGFLTLVMAVLWYMIAFC